MNIISATCRLGENNPYASGPLVCEEIPMSTEKGNQAVVLVHGYNNSAEEADETYQEIINGLQIYEIDYGLVVKFDWPGSKRKLGFPFATDRADISGFRLVELVYMLRAKGWETTLVSHSLGARVVLRALQEYDFEDGPIEHLLMMAPAVDSDCMSFDPRTEAKGGGEFYRASCMAKKVTVLYSGNDQVLKWAYWLSEVVDWLRHKTWGSAMGLSGLTGVYEDRVHPVNCEQFVDQHSDYMKQGETYRIWKGRL